MRFAILRPRLLSVASLREREKKDATVKERICNNENASR